LATSFDVSSVSCSWGQSHSQDCTLSISRVGRFSTIEGIQCTVSDWLSFDSKCFR